MNLGLESKCALVMGGGSGLGAAVARALAAEGAHVAVAGRTPEPLEATVETIARDGGRAEAFALDLSDLESFPGMLGRVREAFGEVTILFNNSGGPPPAAAAAVDADLWSQQFRAMVLGVIHLTDLVIPDMQARGWGRIITNTSSGIVAPIPNLAISNSLRASLLGWSKTLAAEVGRDGITVNVVLPGRVATRRVRALDEFRAKREGISVEEAERASAATIPVGRYGRPEEYGAAVAFLASEAASYITGSTLRVDGGLIPAI